MNLGKRNLKLLKIEMVNAEMVKMLYLNLTHTLL